MARLPGHHMARQATGTVRLLKSGHYEAVIRVSPSARRGIDLGTTDEREALQLALELAQGATVMRKAGFDADRIQATLKRYLDPACRPEIRRLLDATAEGRAKPAAVVTKAVPTFRTFAETWTSGELHRKFHDHVPDKKSAESDRIRLERHIYPHVGDVPLDKFTKEHAYLVLSKLPAGLKPRTRRHVAQLVSRVLSLAANPCCVIERSPLTRGFLPQSGPRPKFAILYPDEDIQLLGHTDIPLHLRVMYGVAHREGMRRSEIFGLQWLDLDLKRGTCTLLENKTEAPRAWCMQDGTTRALKAYKKRFRANAEPTDHVFADDSGHVNDGSHTAERLRADLLAAGCDRYDLHHDRPNAGRFSMHGLRRSFVTLYLAAGKTETWIADRTGHMSSVQINQYRQDARTLHEANHGRDIDPPVDLDIAIPELAPSQSAHERHTETKSPSPKASRTSSKFHSMFRRDLREQV